MPTAEEKKAIREALKKKQRSEALRANLKRRKEQVKPQARRPVAPVSDEPAGPQDRS